MGDRMASDVTRDGSSHVGFGQGVDCDLVLVGWWQPWSQQDHHDYRAATLDSRVWIHGWSLEENRMPP